MAVKRITIEQYYQMPTQDVHDELIRGRVVIRPLPGGLHAATTKHVCDLLTSFVLARKLGRVSGRTAVITHRDPDSMRGPDLSYWSRAQCESRACWHPEMIPDLIAEIVDEDESFETLRLKTEEYLGAGVRRVWLIDPYERKVSEHVTTGSAAVLSDSGTLSGGELLPGFACRVSGLFV